jgi:xanthine dehydrogenase accessory factor
VLELIDQILLRSGRGEPVALCAIVRTGGSTPQAKGAAMLVLEDGQTLGTLGGGCVEAEVRKRALELIQSRQSRLLTFRLDHDYGWDDGLICGGVMDVAVQVIDSPASAGQFEVVKEEHAAGRGAVLEMTVTDEKGAAKKFAVPLARAETLIIAGGGHVGMALGQLAAKLDFHLTVIDDRSDYASPARFADANCIVGDIETELRRLTINEQTYVVIVTRGHNHDGKALAAAIGRGAKYIGLIGSRRKVHTIFRDLHERGVSREELAKVHAPIGLEIGALTPAEIAVSIMAELVAVRRGKGNAVVLPMKVGEAQLDKWFRRESKS